MLCEFCGHHLAKCHDGNLRAKHYSHQRRCKPRQFYMENRGVLRLLSTFNREKNTIICPFGGKELGYCEAGCINHKFCLVHWSHFEDKGARVEA